MTDPFKNIIDALSGKEKGRELTEQEQQRQVEEAMANLPILEHAAEIRELIKNNQTSIIIGETGSGKTTQIPLLLRQVLPQDAKVAITQPRRVAARSVSKYVAGQVGCEIGDEVGYQVRFDDHTTEGTRINFMTDGILLRQMQQDPLLKEYAAVMVDEAHERSLNIDFILGLLKRTQRLRQQNGLEPLKIIVTSATLEKDKFLNFFDQPPAVEVPGRLFPVDIHYEQKMPEDYTQAAAEKVRSIINQGKEGDILIFMPGYEEIKRTMDEIEKLKLTGLMVLPLYGDMSPEDQDRIFMTTPVRKVIVSTNIAETSVTVPGVRHVIDSGFIKQKEFNAYMGIEALKATRHAQSGCIQRAGRAGRLAAGDCYRLFTEDDFLKERLQYQVPEMLRSNLAHVVLMMKNIGINDVKSFEFVDPPQPEVLDQALESLKSLGALDDQEKMTPIGETMAELPLEPHISRMVIEAQKYNCVETVCTIAAFLGGRNVFVRPKDKESDADEAHAIYKNKDSDFLTFFNAWQAYEMNNGNTQRAYDWAKNNFLNFKVLQEVKEVRYQLFKALSRNGIRATENQDPDAIGKSISAGLIDNLLLYSFKHSYRRAKDGVGGIYIHPGSACFGPNYDLVVPAEVVETEKKDRFGNVKTKKWARTIQVVDPGWIEEIAPQMIRKEYGEMQFNEDEGSWGRSVRSFFKGSLTAFKRSFEVLKGPEAVKALAQYFVEGRIDLPFIPKNKQIMEMIHRLHVLSAGQIPDFTSQDLQNFYIRQLGDISSLRELNAVMKERYVDLQLNANDYVDREMGEEILKENPAAILFNNKQYQINYELTGMGQSRVVSCSVKIPIKELIEIKNIPKLPSGRNLIIEAIDNYGNITESMSSVYLDDLKKKVSRHLNKEIWEVMAPREQYIGDIGDFLDRSLPTLPGPESVGVDALTSEALIAYPAYLVIGPGSYARVYIKYFMSEEEAKEEQYRTDQEILRIKRALGKDTKVKNILAQRAPEKHKETKTAVMEALEKAKQKKFGKK